MIVVIYYDELITFATGTAGASCVCGKDIPAEAITKEISIVSINREEKKEPLLLQGCNKGGELLQIPCQGHGVIEIRPMHVL
jgi:hypothetical protein